MGYAWGQAAALARYAGGPTPETSRRPLYYQFEGHSRRRAPDRPYAPTIRPAESGPTQDPGALPRGSGSACATDQILYNLTRRGSEHDLIPWLAGRGIPVMAYSPVEQGRLLGHHALSAVAARIGATPAQVALAWVLRERGVIAIPKAGTVEHVRENRAAADLELSDAYLAELDAAFPRPHGPRPLEML